MENVPRESWWQRNRKLALVACAGLLGVGVVVVALLFVVMGSMKSSVAYKQGLAQAQASPSVGEALGQPIEAGFFVTGSISVTGPSGKADLGIPVHGPLGKGTLYVTAEKRVGEWAIE